LNALGSRFSSYRCPPRKRISTGIRCSSENGGGGGNRILLIAALKKSCNSHQLCVTIFPERYAKPTVLCTNLCISISCPWSLGQPTFIIPHIGIASTHLRHTCATRMPSITGHPHPRTEERRSLCPGQGMNSCPWHSSKPALIPRTTTPPATSDFRCLLVFAECHV
jgi:hypothetical protein